MSTEYEEDELFGAAESRRMIVVDPFKDKNRATPGNPASNDQAQFLRDLDDRRRGLEASAKKGER